MAQDPINIISDDVLYTDPEEFRSRENIRYVMEFGILHRAAALLNKDNTNIGRFSVQFGSDRPPIRPSERAYLNSVLPHIAKAIDLGRPARQLLKEHQAMLAAMDRLSIGLCILDSEGYVTMKNEEFRRQQEQSGVFATAADGRLFFHGEESQRRYLALKSDVERHGRFGARPRKEAVTAETRSHLCIELAPLNRSDELGTRPLDGFILYSTDTSLPNRFNLLPVKMTFGLTDTETEIVASISEGLTNRQIADQRGRSVATVNAQVKSILSKTNCPNRTQLVRLMLSFGGSFLSG